MIFALNTEEEYMNLRTLHVVFREFSTTSAEGVAGQSMVTNSEDRIVSEFKERPQIEI
jgi:hypothetical protein